MPKLTYKQSRFTLILAILGLFLFFPPHYSNFLLSIQAAQPSPDAIAIRVIPNPNHYSAWRWYSEQGFTGSPQSLTVDGYEAVRDGRTVYVNAANVVEDNLYTNIYLISYNQQAQQATQDILAQILSHWKFNANIIETGYCSPSTAVKSEQASDIVCLTDADCPDNEYCNSFKAKVTRDTKRLAGLAEIKLALANYKQNHGRYPSLDSGTYLPHYTISTWPSWQETLANELNLTLPSDPINKLGACPETYNEVTCWNEETKQFADSDPLDPELNLPDGSRAYVYSSSASGDSSIICAVMESGLITTLDQGACTGSEQTVQYISATENHAPIITGVNLFTAYSGQPYQGYISASDPDGDYLTWSIDTSATDWTMWSAAPTLENTPFNNQKAIKADVAGIAGNYDFVLTLDDNRGGVVSQSYSITVENSKLPVIQAIPNQVITIGNNLDLTILAQEADSQYPLTFEFTGLPNNFPNPLTVISNEANQHDYHLSGAVEDQTKDYNVTVVVYDIYQGKSAPVGFTITVANQPPAITSTPITNAIACMDYFYDVEATDPDGHTVEYFDLTNSLPANLSLNQATGVITGQVQAPGSYNIIIAARDQYYGLTDPAANAEDKQSYTLEVADEVFTVTAPADDYVYVAPEGVEITELYHFPITYFGIASKSTANSVSWSRTTDPSPLPNGFTIIINSATGEISATANDNANHPGSYTITVIATNNCGASYSDSFALEVLANEWCGDGVVQAAQDEQCDDGADNTNTPCTPLYGSDCTYCDISCQSQTVAMTEWCGDGIVQSAYEQCETV